MIKKSKTFLSVDLFMLLMSFFEILLSQKGIFSHSMGCNKKKVWSSTLVATFGLISQFQENIISSNFLANTQALIWKFLTILK